MDKELVSVVIPAFNAERTINETLNSVRHQSYGHLEISVVDDGSKDATAVIARRHAAEDPRIKIITIQNGGVANARNIGIAATKGPYIAMIDADDVWHRDKIALQMRAMQEGGEDVGYVYCLSRRIDEQDRFLRNVKSRPMQGRIYLRSIVFNPVGNGSSILARRSALESVGGFETDPEVQGAEDNLVQIMMNRNWLAFVVPLYLTGYRETTNSLSSDFSRMSRRRLAVLRHVARRFPETPARVLSIAEGRLRGIIAAQAFLRHRPAQGLAELARGFQLARLIALENTVVNLTAPVSRRVGSAISRSFHGETQRGRNFFDYDPASGIEGVPRRPLEQRLLTALGESEEAFFQSFGPNSSAATPEISSI